MKQQSLRIRWVDQIVADTKGVSDFYTKLLGFEQEAVEEGVGMTSYCLNDQDGENIFGIVEERMFKDWPHGWVLYFEVADDEYEASCEKAEQLGAEVLHQSAMQCLMKDPAGTPIVINPAKFIADVKR